MICPPLPKAPLVEDWLKRHADRVSFALHVVGIPPTLVGVMLMPVYIGMRSLPVFLVALVAFLGGYSLQFAGHWADGTESGEMRWIKRQWRVRVRGIEADQKT